MGSSGAGIAIAELLHRLTSSPRVQYLGNQFKQTLPQVSGPLRFPNSPIGAQSRYGGTGDLSGVGSAIQKAAGLFGGSQGQQQQTDPLMSLYQQLVSQLQQPVDMPSGIDTEDLMNQVRKAINPIYDQRAEAAQSRTGRARKDVQGMYGALAKDYERLAPEQVAQAAQAQEDIKQLYGQLRSNIEGSYSRVSEEQGNLFKSLGIEAALPDVLADQAPAVQEASIAASENQAQQEQRYMDIGQTDATYYREGSPNATMTGNEISTDMLSQLQDQLAQIEAERTSGIQTGYMDQLGQAQTQLGQQQQMAQSEAARRQEMLWQMLSSQLNSQSQATKLTPDTFMSQLPPEVQQSVAGAFTQLQRSPEAVYGKVEDKRNPVPGTFVETTPEWYMAQADAMLQNGQIDASTHQALLMFIQLQMQSGG